MSDIADGLDIGNTIKIGDKEYTLKRPHVKDLGMIQAEIKKQKIKVWLETAKEMELDEAERAKELKVIMNSSISDEETFEFMDTLSGKRILFYLALKDNPGVTLDIIDKLLEEDKAQEVVDALTPEISGPSEDRAGVENQ